ncbi:MAG: alpha/beta hydrolase [Sedimenticolaceae bacterium]
MQQAIKFCTAPDGVRIAYAVTGNGPPLVKVGNWFTHLELDWGSPVWGHVLEGLSEHRQLVRYDVRGTGLSQRDVPDIAFEDLITDLAAVVDAARVHRFPLFAISQGGAVSIAYTVRHPERVSHLILLGGFARGLPHRGPEEAGIFATQRSIIRQGWGSDDPSYRELFSQQFLPDGGPEQLRWFGELERSSASAETAEKIYVATQTVDVRPLLPDIRVPTLVLHCRGDRRVPYEMGCELAAGIPGARFVTLESKNHLLLDHEPATEILFDEVASFLGDKQPKKWNRRLRVAERKLNDMTVKVEMSPIYKVVGILGVFFTLLSFIVWLLA